MEKEPKTPRKNLLRQAGRRMKGLFASPQQHTPVFEFNKTGQLIRVSDEQLRDATPLVPVIPAEPKITIKEFPTETDQIPIISPEIMSDPNQIIAFTQQRLEQQNSSNSFSVRGIIDKDTITGAIAGLELPKATSPGTVDIFIENNLTEDGLFISNAVARVNDDDGSTLFDIAQTEPAPSPITELTPSSPDFQT